MVAVQAGQKFNLGPVSVHLRGVAAPSYTGPGDVVASAYAWWGLRAYSAATAGGSAVQLYKSSDSYTTPHDVVTLANGSLDTSDAWFDGSTYHVATLYDQTGNGHHLTQSTDANRPIFSLTSCSGKPGVATTQASHHCLYNNSGVTADQPFSYSIVFANADQSQSNAYVLSQAGSENELSIGSAEQYNIYSGSIVSSDPIAYTSAVRPYNVVLNGAGSILDINGTQKTGNAGTNSLSAAVITLGAYNGGASLWSSIICGEAGIWQSDFTSSIASLRTNQKNYWSI